MRSDKYCRRSAGGSPAQFQIARAARTTASNIMNRCGWLLLCMIAGCSTHPIGDALDFFKPGKVYSDNTTVPYGGVCRNQGPVCGPGSAGPPQINVGPPQPVF